MRIAVFSDIHSNYVALDACMEYLERHPVERILFLGDNISDCPEPELTNQRIEEIDRCYQTHHIRGNREEYFIDHEDGKEDGWCYSSYKGSLLYTYEHLRKDEIETYRNRPDHMILHLEGMDDILLVHGSPHSSRELLHPEKENTNLYLRQMPVKLMLSGHTHHQFTYRFREKLLINPGSIGVAIGKPKTANFAVLEWTRKGWNYELITVPFDYDEVKKQFLKSSLMEKAAWWPRCILKSMETGVNMGPLCAKRAYDLALQSGTPIVHNSVPEEYWTIAAGQLGIDWDIN